MADAHLTTEQGNLGIVEDFRYQAHAPVSANGFAIMHRDARRLLSPMLQGIEGIVNGLRYVVARLIEGNPDNAAGIVQLFSSSNPPFSSTCDF
jgi:hypothetical protein